MATTRCSEGRYGSRRQTRAYATTQDLTKRKQEACKTLRQAQSNYEEHGATFLEELVEHMEQTQGVDKQTAQKQMQAAEMRNRTFSQVRGSKEEQTNQLTWMQVNESKMNWRTN